MKRNFIMIFIIFIIISLAYYFYPRKLNQIYDFSYHIYHPENIQISKIYYNKQTDNIETDFVELTDGKLMKTIIEDIGNYTVIKCVGDLDMTSIGIVDNYMIIIESDNDSRKRMVRLNYLDKYIVVSVLEKNENGIKTSGKKYLLFPDKINFSTIDKIVEEYKKQSKKL